MEAGSTNGASPNSESSDTKRALWGGRLIALLDRLIVGNRKLALEPRLDKIKDGLRKIVAGSHRVPGLAAYRPPLGLKPAEIEYDLDIAALGAWRNEIEKVTRRLRITHADDPTEYFGRRPIEAKRLGLPLAEIDRIVGVRKSFEHSNTYRDHRTERGTSDRSNNRSNEGAEASNTHPADLYEMAREIIESPDPLKLVGDEIRARGYAGDVKPAQLAYMAVASRFQDRPMNLFVEAQAASGKNFLIDAALELHPPEAFYKLNASSPRALIYCNESFKNRVVVMGECDSIPEEGPAASAVRSIAYDAAMSYEVVEKNPETEKYETRRIVKEGPTGLITTGVRPLGGQMTTRMLTISVPDDSGQTRDILAAQARAAAGQQAEARSPETFHAYQRWLAVAGEKRVTIPFAPALASLMPDDRVRLRRDFRQLLGIMMTSAYLSQNHRRRCMDGSIEANFEDYERGRELLATPFDTIIGDGITAAVRQTVAAVPEDQELSEAELVELLGLAKATISYRVRKAIRGGWLKNLETRRGYAARLTRGIALPEDKPALPTVGQLREVFESQNKHSNTYSNGLQATGGVRRNEQPFECSNDFRGIAIDDGEMVPDADGAKEVP